MEELPSSSSPTNNYGAFNNTNGTTASEAPQQQRHSSDEDLAAAASMTQQSKEVLLFWRKPWMTALVLFFVFFIIWAYAVVITRYWIKEDWDEALPGLGTSALRKLSMRSHMTFGAIAILCAPIQMLLPFTSGWKKKNGTTTSVTRNWYRTIHRYTGRAYVMCAIMSFFFGQWFICLKEFVLVGGYNMGVAFSVAGFFIAYFAYMTWKTAPSNIRSNTNTSTSTSTSTNGTKYTIEDHRNYAIRSFSQIIAPVLYRYWYLLMALTNVYRTPYIMKGDHGKDMLVCNDRNVCDDYLRPLDAMYAWLYWISAWVVAEIIIACLPPKRGTVAEQTQTIGSVSVSVSALGDDGMKVPLLENDLQEQPPTTDDESEHTDAMESGGARAIVNGKDDRPVTTLVVNFVGCLLAVLCAMVTCPILYMMVKSIFTKSAETSLA